MTILIDHIFKLFFCTNSSIPIYLKQHILYVVQNSCLYYFHFSANHWKLKLRKKWLIMSSLIEFILFVNYINDGVINVIVFKAEC